MINKLLDEPFFYEIDPFLDSLPFPKKDQPASFADLAFVLIEMYVTHILGFKSQNTDWAVKTMSRKQAGLWIEENLSEIRLQLLIKMTEFTLLGVRSTGQEIMYLGVNPPVQLSPHSAEYAQVKSYFLSENNLDELCKDYAMNVLMNTAIGEIYDQ